MDLELSADQRDLAEIADQLLDRHAPPQLARDHLDGHGDPSGLWRAVAEVGWYAVGIDEDDPFGLPGLSLLSRAWGAHVAPGPFVDTALAARLLAGADGGSAGHDDGVARLAAGESTASLAVLEDGVDWSLIGFGTAATSDADGYVIDGTKVAVAHGARADFIVVLADRGGEPAWAFVEAGCSGLAVDAEAGIDPSRAPATVTLTGVRMPANRLVPATSAELERIMAIGAVATAAEGLGAASRALDLAVAYALERRQFGRVIGSFQALQHVLADAHVLREAAWSSILYASAALDDATDDALEAATIAKAYASRAAREVVEAALQVFGGVAFTWEHDAHLYQRRVLECERRFGDSLHHEGILAEQLVKPVLSTR